MSSLAFFASPIDFRKNDKANQDLQDSKKKIDLNLLKQFSKSKNSKEEEINQIHANMHEDLKEENESILTDFYDKEMKEDLKKQISNHTFSKDSYPGENVKTDYLISNNVNANQINYEQIPMNQNDVLMKKLNYIIELFEDQKEIKTNQKNEEVVLYCFLGIFVIYVLDSFVYIGKYKR